MKTTTAVFLVILLAGIITLAVWGVMSLLKNNTKTSSALEGFSDSVVSLKLEQIADDTTANVVSYSFFTCPGTYQYSCPTDQKQISTVGLDSKYVTASVLVTLAKPTTSGYARLTVYNNDIALYTVETEYLTNDPADTFVSKSDTEYKYEAPAAWITGFITEGPWMPGEQTIEFGFATPDINVDQGYIDQFRVRFEAYDQDSVQIIGLESSVASGELCSPDCTNGNTCILNVCKCGDNPGCSGYDYCANGVCCSPSDFLPGLLPIISQQIPAEFYAFMTTPDPVTGVLPTDEIYSETSTSIDAGKLHITTIHTYTHVWMSPYPGIPTWSIETSTDPTAICYGEMCTWVQGIPGFDILGVRVSPPTKSQVNAGAGMVIELDISLENFAIWGLFGGNSSDLVSEKAGTITFKGPFYVTVDESSLTVTLLVSRDITDNLLTVVSTNLNSDTTLTVHTDMIQWSSLNPVGADLKIKGSILDGLKDQVSAALSKQLDGFGAGLSFISSSDLVGLVAGSINGMISPENVQSFLETFIFPLNYTVSLAGVGDVQISVDPTQTVVLKQKVPTISDSGVLTIAVEFQDSVEFKAIQVSSGTDVCPILGLIGTSCNQVPAGTTVTWELSLNGKAASRPQDLWLVLKEYSVDSPTDTLVTDALGSSEIKTAISESFNEVSAAFWACSGW